MVRTLVVGLLGVHAALLMACARRDFVTVDEYAHVPAGLSHWQTNSFALYKVNPPLARMLAVVPVLLADPAVEYDHLSNAPGIRTEWAVAADFIRLNGDRYFNLIQLARISTIAWSILGGWLVFAWSRQLYGLIGGLLSLAVWCFGPFVLGHGHLATPGVPAAVSGFGATYAYWRYLKRPTWSGALFCGLLLGIALLIKFTCLLLLAIWPLLWLLHQYTEPAGLAGPKSWIIGIGQFASMLAVGVLAVDCGFGFTRVWQPLGSFSFVSRSLAGPPPDGEPTYELSQSGNRFRESPLGRLPVPLPADYIEGIDVQRRDFERGMPSYLRGELRHRGWWYYYLYALGVKIPVGLLILFGSAVAVTILGAASPPHRVSLAMLLIPIIVFLSVVSSQTSYN